RRGAPGRADGTVGGGRAALRVRVRGLRSGAVVRERLAPPRGLGLAALDPPRRGPGPPGGDPAGRAGPGSPPGGAGPRRLARPVRAHRSGAARRPPAPPRMAPALEPGEPLPVLAATGRLRRGGGPLRRAVAALPGADPGRKPRIPLGGGADHVVAASRRPGAAPAAGVVRGAAAMGGPGGRG